MARYGSVNLKFRQKTLANTVINSVYKQRVINFFLAKLSRKRFDMNIHCQKIDSLV